MALIFNDRVLETSTTTGTGALTLAAAITGYQRFADAMATNDTCYYFIQAVDGNGNPSGDWETGLGTYSSANTLTRTTPQQSSNADAAVNFGAGTKYVAISATAAFIATLYRSGGTDVAVADGGTGSSTAAGARTNLGADVYMVSFFATTAPTANEVLAIHVVTDAFTFPANFGTPDSRGAVGTNPAATFDVDVQRQVNATGAFASIGTVTVSTGGAFTFATASGTAKTIAANDVIRVVAPGTPDASILNLAVSLRGSRT